MTIAENITELNPAPWKVKAQCRALHIRRIHTINQPEEKDNRIEWRFGDGSGIFTYKNGRYEVSGDIKQVLPDFM